MARPFVPKYSPDQPRDDAGRFASGGGGESGGPQTLADADAREGDFYRNGTTVHVERGYQVGRDVLYHVRPKSDLSTTPDAYARHVMPEIRVARSGATAAYVSSGGHVTLSRPEAAGRVHVNVSSTGSEGLTAQQAREFAAGLSYAADLAAQLERENAGFTPPSADENAARVRAVEGYEAAKLPKAEKRDYKAALARSGSTYLSTPERLKYSPDQPRDEKGQWTAGDESSASGRFAQSEGTVKLKNGLPGHEVSWGTAAAGHFAQGYAAREAARSGEGASPKQQRVADAFDAAYKEIQGRAGFAGSGTSTFVHNESGKAFEVNRVPNGKTFWGTDHGITELPAGWKSGEG